MGSLVLRLLCGVIVAAAAVFECGCARTFDIGGRDGWVLAPAEGYNHWAERNRFLINDILAFKYKSGQDSVLQVTAPSYYTCNATIPILNMSTGDDSFKLDHSGPFYFISGVQAHCQKGQKLIVVVLSPRPLPTAAPPKPAAAPTAVTPPSPSPTAAAPVPHSTIPPSPATSPGTAPATTPAGAHVPSPGPATAPSTPRHGKVPAAAPAPAGPTSAAPTSISPATAEGNATAVPPSGSHGGAPALAPGKSSAEGGLTGSTVLVVAITVALMVM
ncbi:hypothetical protein Droror1_Dr00015083 [Drosera rotundifolia]